MADSKTILKRLDSTDNEILREAAFEAGEAELGEAVPRLAELLGSSNLGVQEAADRAMRRIGGQDVVRAVIPLLRSDEAPVRNLSMDILRQVSDQDQQSVVELLSDEDPDIRIFAADILGSSGNPLVVKPLCDALLKDPEVNVRYQAAVSLGELARPDAAECLGRAMNDEEWVQYATVEALAKVGDAGSADALVRSLDHASELVQSMVVDALAEVGNVKAAGKLLKRMDQAPVALRNKIVKAVVRILGAESLKLLSPEEREKLRQYMLVALEEGAGDEQDAAMEGLSHLGGEPASRAILGIAAGLDPDRDADRLDKTLDALASIGLTSSLAKALGEGTGKRAMVAATAASRIDSPDLSKVLMDSFWKAERALQRQIVDVLSQRAGEEAKDFFLEVLDRHEDGSVLKAAARFLGSRLHLAEAVDRLFWLLEHPYDDVKEAALEAIIAVDGPEVLERFKGMYGSPEPINRLMSVYAVGRIDPGGNLDFLSSALEDEIPDVRKVALEAASAVCADDEQCASLVGPRLGDESREVRLAVVDILGGRPGPVVADYLEQALEDEDDWVRVRAIEALGRNHDHRAVPRLVELLAHPNRLVAIKSIEALGMLGGQEAFQALLELTSSSDEELSRAAEEAVERISSRSSEDA